MFLNSMVTILMIVLTSAYFTLAERKLMASMQRRLGPNVVGFWGVLQPWADAFKLALKENLLPFEMNLGLYLLSPFVTLWLSLLSWCFIPFGYKNAMVDSNYAILFLLCMSALNVYGVIFAGWSSNSKYALLGAFSTVAQMISYEVSLGFCILMIILFSGSLNLSEIIYQQDTGIWFVMPLLPIAAIFYCSMLAETNSAPFDLPEAESELVAGYNVEYSSLFFAMFFLAEYSSMMLMNALFIMFFFGGWSVSVFPTTFTSYPSLVFSFKIVVSCMSFVIVSASNPSYRFDALIKLAWKDFLPMEMSFLIFTASMLKVSGGFYVKSTPCFNMTDTQALLSSNFMGFGQM